MGPGTFAKGETDGATERGKTSKKLVESYEILTGIGVRTSIR